MVLDPSLLDLAVVPAGGSADGVAVDCAGSTRGLAARGRRRRRLPDRRRGHRRRRARDRPHPRRRAGDRRSPTRTNAPIGDAVDDDAIDRSSGAGAGDHRGRSRRHDGGRARHHAASTPRSASSTASPSARSRRCSTCSPRRGCWSKVRSAWRSTRRGPSTRCRRGDALEAGAVAKAYCARAARTVCETAIQVHGGIGNTWECFVHVYLRRALLSSALLGDEGHHLRGAGTPSTGSTTVDFDDSPEEAAFRARIRAWLVDNNPGLPASSTDDEYWAQAGRVALRALRRRVLRAHLAEARTAATSCRRCTRSSSTRSSRRRARRPSRASAT